MRKKLLLFIIILISGTIIYYNKYSNIMESYTLETEKKIHDAMGKNLPYYNIDKDCNYITCEWKPTSKSEDDKKWLSHIDNAYHEFYFISSTTNNNHIPKNTTSSRWDLSELTENAFNDCYESGKALNNFFGEEVIRYEDFLQFKSIYEESENHDAYLRKLSPNYESIYTIMIHGLYLDEGDLSYTIDLSIKPRK